jgi:pectate lyase
MFLGMMLVLSTACSGEAMVVDGSSPPGVITAVVASDASVPIGESPPASVALTATVVGTGVVDKAVTWELEPGPDGCGPLGASVTPGGLFTAPTSSQTSVGAACKVIAKAVADPTKAGTSSVALTAPPTGPGGPPPPTGAVPAFPGAEGGGALSRGGRGGSVYRVTNLNDAGPGSLRACVEASGPRTCVFTTGGRINLSSVMLVTNPYLTIAGQTAQGGGIEVVGTYQGNYVLRIYTHDVVIRYLRLFNGATCTQDSQGCGVVAINDGAQNVILDHVTAAFTQDENISVWCGASPCPSNVTVSWSLNAWPLADHPTGTAIGAESSSLDQTLLDVDYHHNYYVDASSRAPLGSGRRARWAYNAVLNWYNYGARYSNGSTSIDFVGNIYRCGGRTPCSGSTTRQAITFAPEWYWLPGTPSVYFHNNVWKNADGTTKVAGNLSDTTSWQAWAYVVASSSATSESTTPAPGNWRTGMPLAAAGIPIAASGGVPYAGYAVAANGSNLETQLFDSTATGDAARGTAYGPVGASRRLDCAGNWVDNRDGLWNRAILEYVGGGDPAYAPMGGVSSLPTTQTAICWASGQCGIPSLAAGTACADSDSDGIPDAYEDANGLNKLSAADAQALQPDGHTNLEHYLSGGAAP